MSIKAIAEKIKAPFTFVSHKIKEGKWFLASFLFAFIIVLTFIDITLSRNAAIKQFKINFSRIINNLNEVGLDIAYEDLQFNSIYPYPLIKLKNFQVYNLRGEHLWKLKLAQIECRPNLLNAGKLNFEITGDGEFSFDKSSKKLTAQRAELLTEFGKQGDFKELQTYIDELNIKDFAKVKSFVLAMRKSQSIIPERAITPTVESHVEIRDVALNGLLNYPLTSEIKRIYAKFNLMGEMDVKESLPLVAETWLHNGGFIEVPSLIINWEPLHLEGRGDIRFDEEFSPKLQLQTSSKAMLNLLEDLQNKNYLDKKGVFVANILLGAKAYKLNKDDKYLTISTPITYRENKLAIENITVKTLEDKSGQ